MVELHRPVTHLNQHGKDLNLVKLEGYLFLYWPKNCILMPLIPKGAGISLRDRCNLKRRREIGAKRKISAAKG